MFRPSCSPSHHRLAAVVRQQRHAWTQLSSSRRRDLQPSRHRRAAVPWIPPAELLVMASSPIDLLGGPAPLIDSPASEEPHGPSTTTTSPTSSGLHLTSALPIVHHQQAPCLGHSHRRLHWHGTHPPPATTYRAGSWFSRGCWLPTLSEAF